MRVFDPVRLADLETRMWQAYYEKSRVRLFSLLVTMLREQYGYSWATAADEAFHLGRAASTFADIRSDYEQVLPDLEHAYQAVRDRHDAGFDAAAVARAELAWWVARRVPGTDSPEQVGALIAEEYALLYGAAPKDVLKAAVRRAEAAALRDRQAAEPEWATIRRMLEESYRDLHAALSDE